MNMGSNPNRSRNDGHGSGPAISTAERLKKGRLNQGAGKLKNRALNRMPIDWDFEKPSGEYFQELFRVSKNQIIWGGNYFDLPPTRGIICWDKMQPWENFSQWEMAWTSYDRPASIFRFSNTGGANQETKIHPTQKPVALYKWCLKKYAMNQDGIYLSRKILDTHLGSGSSRIAAYLMGFDFYGFEISSDYYQLQGKRFKEQTAQQQFFI